MGDFYKFLWPSQNIWTLEMMKQNLEDNLNQKMLEKVVNLFLPPVFASVFFSTLNCDDKQHGQAQSDRCKILTDGVPISSNHPSISNLVSLTPEDTDLSAKYSLFIFSVPLDGAKVCISYQMLTFHTLLSIFGCSWIFLISFD